METVSFGYGGGDEEIGDNNDRSDSRRDKIAEDVWRGYQRVWAKRGLDETDEESDQELFDSDEWDGEGEDYKYDVQTL